MLGGTTQAFCYGALLSLMYRLESYDGDYLSRITWVAKALSVITATVCEVWSSAQLPFLRNLLTGNRDPADKASILQVQQSTSSSLTALVDQNTDIYLSSSSVWFAKHCGLSMWYNALRHSDDSVTFSFMVSRS
nr:hypothetical protein Iba_chr08cCG13870 [Ipomoea batatas]